MEGDGNGKAQETMQGEPIILHETIIQVLDNGSIRVLNVLPKYDEAMELMLDATKMVADLYVQKAKEGKVVNASKLILPVGNIISPFGN